MWQNGTGINAVNVSWQPNYVSAGGLPFFDDQYYSPTFFRSIGLSGQSTPLLTTGIFGVIKTIGALLWAFWVRRVRSNYP